MADTTPAAPASGLLTALTPSINAIVTAVVWALLGAGGIVGYAHLQSPPAVQPPPAMTVQSPKPVPTQSIQVVFPDAKLAKIEADLGDAIVKLDAIAATLAAVEQRRRAAAARKAREAAAGPLGLFGAGK